MAFRSPDFLAHAEGDSVAVAVRDLQPGPAEGHYLRGRGSLALEVLGDVPLGHKLALTDITAGEEIIEYGMRTAMAAADVKKGEYVHVHNVRSARWHNSVV